MKRILFRSLTECTAWGAVLGAFYLPAGVYLFVGLSSLIDSGTWDSIDSLDPWILWLGLLGFVIGGAIGLVTGVLIALPLSLAVRGNAGLRCQRVVGASAAAVAVALMTGAIALWGLQAPDDAPLWDLMIRPVWVVFSVIVPTVAAAGVIVWRTPRIAGQQTDTENHP
jgi:hypothetical protein